MREAAVGLVWGRYFQALLSLARSHLSARIRSREDEEDVLQSVYKSFCHRQRRGDFNLAIRGQLMIGEGYRFRESMTDSAYFLPC